MKAKLLFSMLVLGVLTAMAQPTAPIVPDNSFHKMITPHHFMIKFDDTAQNPAISDKTMSPPFKGGGGGGTIDPNAPKVNFILDFDTETQRAKRITLVNNTTYTDNYQQGIPQLQQGANILSVPKGTYEIIVVFDQLDTSRDDEWSLYQMYVIREQVTINEDMTMNIAASEANNHIDYQTLTIDGEPVYTGKWTVDENWNWTELEPGNVDDVYYITCIACSDLGNLQTNLGDFGVDIVGETLQQTVAEDMADIYVNDVSERYIFYTYRVAFKGREFYTSASEVVGAAGNITVTNDPSKYKLFQDPFLVPQRQGEQLYPAISFHAIPLKTQSYMGTDIDFITPLEEGEQIKCYVSSSADESNTFFPHFEVFVSEKTIESTPWGEQENYIPVLKSMPLTSTNGHTVFANNGAGAFYNSEPWTHFEREYSEELDDYGQDVKEYPIWPTHPIFTYPVEKKKGILGNNCPLMICNPLQYELTYSWPDENGNMVNQTFYSFIFDYDYIGRYGEKRPNDITDAEFSIRVNDEDFATGQGFTCYELDGLLNGVVDASITNETVLVDDMTGSNTAQLHYTAGAEDQNPPTMTMLHFKANNGDVIDRFATANDGSIEFSAGDFNAITTPLQLIAFNRQAPESVEVSYSPYGEDYWNELAVEEVPENYWPTMGWFYTAPLAGVTGQGLNGWFDLKIRVEDAAGNWQEQVISPAFRIDDLAYSSVVTITPDKVGDNAIYNLAGQRMRGGLESLPHGIYIVGGKKVVK